MLPRKSLSLSVSPSLLLSLYWKCIYIKQFSINKIFSNWLFSKFKHKENQKNNRRLAITWCWHRHRKISNSDTFILFWTIFTDRFKCCWFFGGDVNTTWLPTGDCFFDFLYVYTSILPKPKTFRKCNNRTNVFVNFGRKHRDKGFLRKNR